MLFTLNYYLGYNLNLHNFYSRVFQLKEKLNASSQFLRLIYHDSLCIAAEGVLQEACEFRVSVWNVCTFSINQGRNHISQGGQ
jgi:hypothetical protein